VHAGSSAGRDGFCRQQTVVETFIIQGDLVGEEGSFRRDVIQMVNGTALGRKTPTARSCDPSKQPRASTLGPKVKCPRLLPPQCSVRLRIRFRVRI
jgi:hypothetical protein